jgi:copper resistance protein C
MKVFTGIFLLAIGFLTPALTLAHAKLTEAKPADGALVNEAPDAIALTFNEEVQLLKVTVTGADDKEVATEFTASAAKQTGFAVALPELAKDTYTVTWTIVGDDGHKVDGSFVFSVDPDTAEKAGSTAAESHSEHGH